MDYDIELSNKLKYIMIFSILFDETDRIREYATSEGNLIIPPEVFDCLYNKTIKMLPLKQNVTLEQLCNFLDYQLNEIILGEKTIGFSIKNFRELVDLSNCKKIPLDIPDRANISIIQSSVKIFIEENFYLIMSTLLFSKSQIYRDYFGKHKPDFSAPGAEKKYKNNGDTFGAIYSVQSILSIMNFLDCFISVTISDNFLEQQIIVNLKKMDQLLSDAKYKGTTKHKVMKKGFLIIKNFDLTDFDNEWSLFKLNHKTLDDGIQIRHNITHFNSGTDKSFIYTKSNNWLARAESLLKDVCSYSLEVWQAIHGRQSTPKYLADLNYDNLLKDCRYNVYRELEYSNDVHDFMKEKYEYTD